MQQVKWGSEAHNNNKRGWIHSLGKAIPIPTKPQEELEEAQFLCGGGSGYQHDSDQEEEGENDSNDDKDQQGYELEEANPYNQNFDVDVGAHVSHKKLNQIIDASSQDTWQG